MSAFIVSPEHINALVTFALEYRRPGRTDPPSYRFDGSRIYVSPATADILWQENIRSVRARYPTDEWEDLPGPIEKPRTLEYQRIDRTTVRSFNDAPTDPGKVVIFDAADIICMCNCLDYQSCETDDWEETEAHAAMLAIRDMAVDILVNRAKPQIEWCI